MRKSVTRLVVLMLLFMHSCERYDDSDLVDRIVSLESRVAKLEVLCNQMNTNISSLQTVVNVLATNDYIKSIAPIVSDGKIIGYTISFANSNPITVYNGIDGSDGYVPNIGVKQDVDGVYYWTIDGEWLLDSLGNKIKAEGIDGISPRVKIENECWYVSYDGGNTWSKLGSAVDTCVIINIEENDDAVIFTLRDGTTIVVPKQPRNITFLDNLVKIICVLNWDVNEDQELSYEEAALVENIGSQFQNKEIYSFNELQYFTKLANIPDSAFVGCHLLEKVVVPSSVSHIGFRAFYNCNNLRNVQLSEGLVSVGEYAFYNCNISEIILPNTVKNINAGSFWNCSNLERVILGDSLVSIGNRTFERTNIKELVVPKNVISIGSSAFSYCEALTKINIPKGVTTIEPYLFSGCSSLENIEIHAGVTSIGAYAFSDCKSLLSVYCMPVIPPQTPHASTGWKAFENNASKRKIYVPIESLDLYKQNQYGWYSYRDVFVGY